MKRCVYVVVRKAGCILLYQLSDKWGENKGKWLPPSTVCRPREKLVNAALRAFEEDVGFVPKSMTLRFELMNESLDAQTREMARLYFFSCTLNDDDYRCINTVTFLPTAEAVDRQWFSHEYLPEAYSSELVGRAMRYILQL